MRCSVFLISCALFGGFGATQAAEPAGTRAQMPAAGNSPQIPDVSKSPVDDFRKLLAMNPRQREEVLASKYAEEQRKQLRVKIQEYGAMPSDEREARLRLVQLRWYLLPLMQLSRPERPDKVATIPVEYRTVVEERLKQWDILPPTMKKEVLDHEWTVHYFMRMESKTPAEREAALQNLSPEYRRTVEEKLSNWRALPIDRRQKMYDQVHHFFELPPREKEKTLDALTNDERQKMEASLDQFEKLSPEHRKLCIESFRQFANMTAAERAQFLKNAERWKSMSAQERETWRNLVTLLPAATPPMPPIDGVKQAPRGESVPAKPMPTMPGSSTPP